jgi:hypothetical protein
LKPSAVQQGCADSAKRAETRVLTHPRTRGHRHRLAIVGIVVEMHSTFQFHADFKRLKTFSEWARAVGPDANQIFIPITANVRRRPHADQIKSNAP